MPETFALFIEHEECVYLWGTYFDLATATQKGKELAASQQAIFIVHSIRTGYEVARFAPSRVEQRAGGA